MVRSKAYTLNRLINEVRGLNARNVTSYSDLAKQLSPRRGAKSAKFQVLNTFLNRNLANVVASNKYGATVKQRVLTALKLRKRNGSF